MNINEEKTKEFDLQMLEEKEFIGKKIVDVVFYKGDEGEELQFLLEDGKQIEIRILLSGIVQVQSD